MSTILVNNIKDTGNNTLLTSDGSGTVTASSSLASSVASVGSLANTPAFLVRKTTTQTLTDNTVTKITFDTEVYDTDSAFDLANDKFTVPSGKGGKYFLSATMWGDAVSNNYEFGFTYIYLNGSQHATTIADLRTAKGGQMSVNNNIVLDLSVGDYIEIYHRINDSSGSPTVYGDSGYFSSWFLGYKLIGA